MINMDFTQSVVINTNDSEWVASPKPGVWRKPLAREDAERGHATSIVRYEAGASFHSHNHPGGEEILVLDGTFSDETGDFGKGTYFRNPAGFVHAPFSREGCLILVKLHQFDENDQARLSIQTEAQVWDQYSMGVQQLMLHRHQNEQVRMIRLTAGTSFEFDQASATEGYLLDGQLQADLSDFRLQKGCWWRVPTMEKLTALQDSLLWLKSGHFDGRA
ncbi:MAG: cupin domain-containing protein [Cellvibrionaceae bacterium]